MQRSFLCASVSISFLLLSAPVQAGEPHPPGQGKLHPVIQRTTPPVQPVKVTVSAGVATQPPIHVVRPAQPVLVVPLTAPTSSRPAVVGIGEPERLVALPPPVYVERPIRPLSFNPTDPRAVITRLPSGRIAMSPPFGFYPLAPWQVAESNRRLHPYAQPSFQIIGGGAPQRAAAAVHLIYGVKPGRRMNPEPKVVWLDERGRTPEASPHIRHIK
jgi:hypothetical protein